MQKLVSAAGGDSQTDSPAADAAQVPDDRMAPCSCQSLAVMTAHKQQQLAVMGTHAAQVAPKRCS